MTGPFAIKTEALYIVTAICFIIYATLGILGWMIKFRNRDSAKEWEDLELQGIEGKKEYSDKQNLPVDEKHNDG